MTQTEIERFARMIKHGDAWFSGDNHLIIRCDEEMVTPFGGKLVALSGDWTGVIAALRADPNYNPERELVELVNRRFEAAHSGLSPQ